MSKYFNFSKKLDKYIIEKPSFFARLIYTESIFSDDFFEYVDKMLDTLDYSNVEYYLCENARRYNEIKLQGNYLNGLKLFAYLALNEVITQDSIFTSKVIEDIHKESGEKYLERLQILDKMFLSKDGKNKIESKSNLDISLTKAESIYLLFKKYQDIQRDAYNNLIEGDLFNLAKKVLGKEYTNSFVAIYDLLNKRIRDYLISKEVWNLSSISKFALYEEPDVFKELVGGKTYGLAILLENDVVIPNTHVMLSCFDKINSLDFLNKDIHYAIRSSANIEDGNNKSFAGMFATFLNVEIKDVICKINAVKSSANKEAIKKYAGENIDVKMAVIIQEFYEPKIAGVFIGNDFKNGILEWVKGNGEKLVSGKANPQNEICNLEKESKLKVNNESVSKYLIDLQNKLGCIADFEFCILNNKLVMLQFRPATEKVVVSLNKEIEEGVYYGIGASQGICEGKCKYIRNLKESDFFEKGDILLSKYTDPNWYDLLLKSSAIATAVGGILCHTAIIARELGIPCVVGIGMDAMRKIRNETEIIVDGTNGKVIKK